MFRRSRRWPVLAAAVVCLVLVPAQAQAYTFIGKYWCGNPANAAKLTATFTGPWPVTAYKTAFQNSLTNWNGSTTEIHFTVAAGPLKIGNASDASVTWDGRTTWTASGSCYTGTLSVINAAKVGGYSTNQLLGVAGHELGHSFGLDHSTSNPVMMVGDTPTRTLWNAVVPKTDDINGANARY